MFILDSNQSIRLSRADDVQFESKAKPSSNDYDDEFEDL